MKDKKFLIASLSSLQISLAQSAEQADSRAQLAQEEALLLHFASHAETNLSSSAEKGNNPPSSAPCPFIAQAPLPLPAHTSPLLTAAASLTESTAPEATRLIAPTPTNMSDSNLFVTLEDCGQNVYKISTKLKVNQTIDNLFYNHHALLLEGPDKSLNSKNVQMCIEDGTKKLFKLLSLDPADKDSVLSEFETALRYLFIIDNITSKRFHQDKDLDELKSNTSLYATLSKHKKEFNRLSRQEINSFFNEQGVQVKIHISERVDKIKNLIKDKGGEKRFFFNVGHINIPQAVSNSYKSLGSKLKKIFEKEGGQNSTLEATDNTPSLKTHPLPLSASKPFPLPTTTSIAPITPQPVSSPSASLTPLNSTLVNCATEQPAANVNKSNGHVTLESLGDDAYKLSTLLKVHQIDNLFYDQNILMIPASLPNLSPQDIQACIEDGTRKLFTLLSLDSTNKDIVLSKLETALRYLFIIDNLTHKTLYFKRDLQTLDHKASLYKTLVEHQERILNRTRQEINSFFLGAGAGITEDFYTRFQKIKPLSNDSQHVTNFFRDIGIINRPQGSTNFYKKIGNKLGKALSNTFSNRNLELSFKDSIRTQAITARENIDPGFELLNSSRSSTSTCTMPTVTQEITFPMAPARLAYNLKEANLNKDLQIGKNPLLASDSILEESSMDIVPSPHSPLSDSAESILRKRILPVISDTPSEEPPVKKRHTEAEQEIFSEITKVMKNEMIARINEIELKCVSGGQLAKRLGEFKIYFMGCGVPTDINTLIEYYKIATENGIGNQFFFYILKTSTPIGERREDANHQKLSTSFMNYLDLIKRRAELISRQPSLEIYLGLLNEVKKQSESLKFNEISSIEVLFNQAKEEKKELETVSKNIEELALVWGYPLCF